MRTRNKRNAVRLSARMRSDVGSDDVHILDVSERGMLLSRADPPPPGSYLEVKRGRVAIVARIIWRNGRKFGVRSQDEIDLGGLVAPSPASIAGTVGHGGRPAARRLLPAESAERSRLAGHLIQFACLLAAIGAGTIALTGSVTAALAPLHLITVSLIGD